MPSSAPDFDATLEPVNHQLLVEHSVDMICQVRQMSDGRMRYEYVSPSSAEIVGWTAEEMKSVTHAMIYPPASLSVIREAGRRLVAGSPTTVVTVEAIRKDGKRLWVENRVRILKDEGDGNRTVVVCMRDVTERKLLQDQLAELVLVDTLTGVGNRRAFDSAIDREWAQARDHRSPLSLMLIDVDRFKRINDTHGHQVGDECIRRVAKKVSLDLCGAGAIVARYGGDELAVLLPGLDEEKVHAVGQVLCRSIAAAELLPIEIPLAGAVTISCGASTAHGLIHSAVRMPTVLIAAADRALYTAKELGRNQAAIASLTC